jgi:cobalt-precorrin-5B (C1)-methyltransferase
MRMEKHMILEEFNKVNKYLYKNNKKLRFGYTTGACAAAASKAAGIMLISNTTINSIKIMTPKGILLKLEVLEIEKGENYVSCAIKKDSGDDPDVTNGIKVYSKVSLTNSKEIVIDGGIGVGRVTKEGLGYPVGSAAINKVPRMMIYKEVNKICDNNDYKNGLLVEISIPDGVLIAKKTFNPRLGIVGGISVLGTSRIVEPMSEKALTDTIEVEMKLLKANGAEYLLVTPGNYGQDFTRKNMNINLENSIKCSNYIGESIDHGIGLELKGMLFIGHIGKFIKLAGGIMKTHSRNADARMEIITAYAALAGGETEALKKIMNCITTDEAINILIKYGIKSTTMKLITERINFHLKNRADEKLEIGAIIFSNEHGLLGETENVETLLAKYSKERN